jgi:hypothetical protein
MARIWVEAETVDKCLTDDGDLAMITEDFYFFKRNEIANEDGLHLEFSNEQGGFEIYMTYDEFNRFYRQMFNRVLDYINEKDEYR